MNGINFVVIVILFVSLLFFQFSYCALSNAKALDVIFSNSEPCFTSILSPIFCTTKGESFSTVNETLSQFQMC